MKVIDLLNKIAKGEEVQDFTIYGETYYVDKDGYIKNEYGNVEWSIYKDWLDVEVEIIEEEKEIKEIEVENGHIVDYDETGKHYITTNRKDRNIYINKINELVREVRKLKDLSKCQK